MLIHHSVSQGAASGSVRMLKWLLNQGADINLRNHFGITPIYVGVSTGSESIVRTLLEHNADPNSAIGLHAVLVGPSVSLTG